MGTALCSLPSPRQPSSATPCALTAAGSLPQSPPKGSSTAHGCERGSPKAGAGLATCLGLISHYAF